jgi:CysZ protein
MTHGPLALYTKAERNSVPFLDSARFYWSQKPLMIWSVFILLVMFLVTLLFFSFFAQLIELHMQFIIQEPGADAGAIGLFFWWFLNGLFSLALKVIAFFLSFLIAYTAAAPLYQHVSVMAEDLFRGKTIREDAMPELEEALGDLVAAAKLSAMVFGITIFALIANFIPFIGSILCFAVCLSASALLILDFPTARLGWDLRQKIEWIIAHPFDALRFGLFPALISFIPILSPFIMGLVSPFLIVHGTLNVVLMEENRKLHTATAQTKVIG